MLWRIKRCQYMVLKELLKRDRTSTDMCKPSVTVNMSFESSKEQETTSEQGDHCGLHRNVIVNLRGLSKNQWKDIIYAMNQSQKPGMYLEQ